MQIIDVEELEGEEIRKRGRLISSFLSLQRISTSKDRQSADTGIDAKDEKAVRWSKHFK